MCQKHETNSGNKHCEKSHFTNLTFRMLCNIHFQKYDRYKILTTIIYCKIKETLFIQELQPSLNANVGSERLLLF